MSGPTAGPPGLSFAFRYHAYSRSSPRCRPGLADGYDELYGRVDVGINALRQTDSRLLVLSGAQTNPNVPRAECELMRERAVKSDVDPDRIHLEPQAVDTIGNGYFTRSLVEELDQEVETVRLVSLDYHAARARFVFTQCFGPRYDIDASAQYDADRPGETVYEKRRLRRMREFFAGIEPGDIAAICQRLITHHDNYDAARTVSL
ncbi:YdcF family protein [Natronorubrum halophilum]|uniref:YdcF family protein n=1 Tax=Natronorubrum halophilum TaxID=1702106 RepID=UPI000EF6DE47|nr:YdcF family protein [Natronorubrum halophilum]